MWLKICRCHSKWGLDDSVSFPALGGTEFCKFVLFLIEFFNGDIKKKKKEEFSPVFEQSVSQGPITLTLVDNFSIPGRSECILEAKTPRSYSNQLGMTCPLEN